MSIENANKDEVGNSDIAWQDGDHIGNSYFRNHQLVHINPLNVASMQQKLSTAIIDEDVSQTALASV